MLWVLNLLSIQNQVRSCVNFLASTGAGWSNSSWIIYVCTATSLIFLKTMSLILLFPY